MLFLRISNGEYPISLAAIKASHPSISFPAIVYDSHVQSFGFRRVTEVDQPEFDPLTHQLVETAPVLQSGHYVQAWSVLPINLAVSKSGFIASVKEYRDGRIQTSGYEVDGKWFHSDTFSRTQQIALFSLGANIPSGIQWKTMDGTFVTMTQQLAADVFAAAVNQDVVIFAHTETLISQINLASTISDLAAVDISAGWPAGFQA